MDYKQTIDFLFNQFPAFQKTGASAYKPGLERIEELCSIKNNPQNNYPIVHVAGTNGKGTVCSLLASILKEANCKVGLFTSPHLVDFRERIRINGEKIPEGKVVSFVDELKDKGVAIKPSFFEYTTLMAFDYFNEQNVDIAIIETGLGGRLDCSNVVNPILTIITNIGLDHQQYLGDTLELIAAEKAGIIKPNVPVIIGRRQKGIEHVFKAKASLCNAPVLFAQEEAKTYKEENKVTVTKAVGVLQSLGWEITSEAIQKGLENLYKNSGLRGRWETIQATPRVICDTGHNLDGVKQIVELLKQERYTTLHMVWGTLAEKENEQILSLLPKDAQYYFCEPQNRRALRVSDLAEKASGVGLKGDCFESVKEALKQAKGNAQDTDLVFVGGSTFVVAEVLEK